MSDAILTTLLAKGVEFFSQGWSTQNPRKKSVISPQEME